MQPIQLIKANEIIEYLESFDFVKSAEIIGSLKKECMINTLI